MGKKKQKVSTYLGRDVILLFIYRVVSHPEPRSFKDCQPCGHPPRNCYAFNLIDRLQLGFDAKYRLLDSWRFDSLT